MNKNFNLLLTGQSLANIGDILYTVSIINLIFTLTDSATAASFVPFTITTCMFISSLLTPLLFGKISLKWLMTGSQIGKTILLILLGFLLIVITESTFYWLFLLIGLIAFLDGCANPIRQTLIPYFVNSDQLLKANGISETVTQFVQTVMWFIGSLFLIILSSQQLIWIVGCLFALASILLSFLDNIHSKQPIYQGRKLAQIQKGWKTVSTTPILRKIVKVDILETIAGTVWIAAIILIFVGDALNSDEKWWGFINGAYFLGLIAGSIYCVKYSSFIEKRLGNIIFINLLATSLITVLFSMNSIPIISLFLSLCVGIFGQIKSIPQQTIIQSSVAKDELSTVYTSLGAVATGIFGISSLLMGIIADLMGVRFVFLISGLLLAWASIIIYKNKELFIRNVME